MVEHGRRDVRIDARLGNRHGPVAGSLCDPGSSKTLQILVPGFTYNKSYWDLRYEPARYSYVDAANAAGQATLAIDPVGTGESWHPASSLLTYKSAVAVLQQVVEAVRSGDLGSYEHVVLVGHSYGSVTSYGVAGRFQSVDAVISTGAAHVANYAAAARILFPYLRLARRDPKFADDALDIGYLTTAPGAHNVFAHKTHTDPELLDLNEGALRDVGTLQQLLTLVTNSVQNLTRLNESRGITVPVLLINGAEDPLYSGRFTADCSSPEALVRYERQFMPDAELSAFVLARSGHNVNMDLDAADAYRVMTDFVATIGR